MSYQQNLFDDQEQAPGLVRIDAIHKPLSKEHQAFNKLTKRIDNLQKEIIDTTNKLDLLNAFYQKEVFSKVLVLGRHKIRLSHLLHEKRGRIKLSKGVARKLDKVIVELLNDAFSVIEPTDADKKVYDHYSDESFDEELKDEEEIMKSMMSEIFKEQFGIKLDPAVFDKNPDLEKLAEGLKKQLEGNEVKQKPRKKNKKQQEKELLEQQKEDVKKKSLRSIYLSLAKLLHPDTEQDETLKIEKEEAMKMVTTAYDNKDMMKLLQIEMQWVSTHKQSLDNMDVNTVAIFVELLKDQAKQLESELDMVQGNPKYANVLAFSDAPDTIAKRHINNIGREYDLTNHNIEQHLQVLERSEFPSAAIKECINVYYEEDEDFGFGGDDW